MENENLKLQQLLKERTQQKYNDTEKIIQDLEAKISKLQEQVEILKKKNQNRKKQLEEKES